MTHDKFLIEKVKTVISEVTGNHMGEIDITGDIKTQFPLDSMQFVQLFSALEEAFEIELPLKIMNVSTVEEFLSILDEQLTTTTL